MRQITRFFAITCLGLALLAHGAALQADTAAVKVVLQGLPHALHEPVLNSLSLYQQRDHALLNPALIARLHRRAESEIRTALRPLGYYRPTIDSKLSREDDTWLASYQVDPGPPLLIGAVEITLSGPGAQDPSLRAWQEQFPLRRGDILLHKSYEDAKQALVRLARERGYLQHRFSARSVEVKLAGYAATIRLDFETGPRYLFGPVTFRQQTFDDAFLMRFVPFKSGDPYDAGLLLKLQRNLADSDQFESIEIDTLTEHGTDLQVPIEVHLTPRKPNRYSFGLGYGTDTGARARLGYERRYLNPFGHRVSSELKVSQIATEVNAGYRIPLERANSDYLDFRAGWIEEETDTSQRRTSSLSTGAVHVIGPWQRTLGVSFEREDFEVADESGTSQLIIPRIAFQRASLRKRGELAAGWRFAASLKGAGQSLGSDTTFLQGLVSGKYILPLQDRGRLILRSTAGASWVEEFAELPVSQRFFTGGDYSVRGYAYNSLGTTDDEGNVIGGEHLLVASAEYEHIWSGKYGLALFYDIGNAYDDSSIELNKGAGLGLRWRVPFGTIGLDLAKALSLPGQPWRVHLTIGPDL